MKLNKTHAVIHGQGASKAIKSKNLKYLNRKPLLYWTIKSCTHAREVEKIWVSPDNKKILAF